MSREPLMEMITAEPSVRIAAQGAVETATFAMG